MRYILGILFTAMIASVGIAQTPQEEYTKSVIIREIVLKDAPVIEVLDLLRDYSVENGINGRQLNLIIKSTDPKIIGTNNPMRVTVKFEDITLHEALRHLADVANLDLRFDDNAAVLSDRKKQ